MSLSDQPVTCWLCRKPMDESQEHVLLESITYRASLRVSGFICTRCNNTTGTEWDAALTAACRPAFRADQNYPSHLRESGPKPKPRWDVHFQGGQWYGRTALRLRDKDTVGHPGSGSQCATNVDSTLASV